MALATFDTLKYVERLKAAGMQEQQAIALTEAQRDSFAEALTTQVASHTDIAEVRADISELRNEVRTELEPIRSDVKLIKWILALIVLVNVIPLLKSLFT